MVRVALTAVLEAADSGISRTGARRIRLGAARSLTAGVAGVAGLAWLGTDRLLAVAGITAVAVLTDASTAAEIGMVGVALLSRRDAARARGPAFEHARMAARVVGVAGLTRGLTLRLTMLSVTAVAVWTDAPTAAQIGMVGVARRAIGDAARAGGGILGEPFGRVALAAMDAVAGILERGALRADVVGTAALMADEARLAEDADCLAATLPVDAAPSHSATGTVRWDVTDVTARLFLACRPSRPR